MNDFTVNLDRFINETFEQKIIEALEEAAQVIENQAKMNCPTGNGELRASITHVITKNGAVIVATIGSNIFYAPYVHQGTGLYAIDGDGRKEVPWFYKDLQGKWHSTEGMKPNPFLQDAFDSEIEKVKECFNGLF